MLTWMYELYPLFSVGNKMGKCLILNFGLEYVDDIQINGEDFYIHLRASKAGWRAEFDKAMSWGLINKSMIDNLIREINTALTRKEDYDIVAYILAHKDNESYLSYAVRDD